MVNIVFIWTGVTSYMADCWRALSRMPGIRLKIYIQEKSRRSTYFNTEDVLRGLDYVLIREDECLDKERIWEQLVGFQPTVFFVVGWRAKLSRFIATDRLFSSVPKVLVFDLPFAWTLKKLIAPVVLFRYLKRFRVAFVPGVRATQYARWLGFKRSKIEQGLFSVNVSNLSDPACNEKPCEGFLFVGRYAREKRLDILTEAYKKYRKKILHEGRQTCWTLTCCGMGSFEKYLEGIEGVKNRGFVQPVDVQVLYKTHGALVVTSDFDPWPLVIAEACASGLPIICTKACGNHIELVKENGLVCETNDANTVADAMVQMHNMSDEGRVAMGMRGLSLVRPYSCEAWSERVIRIVSGLA